MSVGFGPDGLRHLSTSTYPDNTIPGLGRHNWKRAPPASAQNELKRRQETRARPPLFRGRVVPFSLGMISLGMMHFAKQGSDFQKSWSPVSP